MFDVRYVCCVLALCSETVVFQQMENTLNFGGCSVWPTEAKLTY